VQMILTNANGYSRAGGLAQGSSTRPGASIGFRNNNYSKRMFQQLPNGESHHQQDDQRRNGTAHPGDKLINSS